MWSLLYFQSLKSKAWKQKLFIVLFTSLYVLHDRFKKNEYAYGTSRFHTLCLCQTLCSSWHDFYKSQFFLTCTKKLNPYCKRANYIVGLILIIWEKLLSATEFYYTWRSNLFISLIMNWRTCGMNRSWFVISLIDKDKFKRIYS